MVNDHGTLLDSFKAILDPDLAFENRLTPRVVSDRNWSGKEPGSQPPKRREPASSPSWTRENKRELSKNKKTSRTTRLFPEGSQQGHPAVKIIP
jgi:spore cortex formation protein SpoVR/YcgB (stage V sporulation)